MSRFDSINLSDLPPPSVVESLDYETVLQQLREDLAAIADLSTVNLESEPVVKLLEVFAYRELLLRGRINDAARSTMVAYALGADLDNLAGLFGVKRQADEPDDRLRQRVQLSLEGHSTAGPIGSYVFHALAADPTVADVNVASPTPGEVLVTVLSNVGTGAADQALLDRVYTRLNSENVRPLTDQVTVQSSEILTYSVDAVLQILPGPDTEIVRERAIEELQAYVGQQHGLGLGVPLSGLYAALHVAGVQDVRINTPSAGFLCDLHQAAYCNSINVTVATNA